MPYTVTSRGRPIGTTDLGFRYRPGASRMGWFHPNAAGERLMPIVAAVTAATRAHAQSRRGRDNPDVDARARDANLLADVAEAYQHIGALDLRLHAEDGTLIPTEFVSIQDTEELLAWADLEEGIQRTEEWKFGALPPDPLYDPGEDLFDEELDAFDEDAESAFDPNADDDLIFGDGFADCAGPWSPDEDEPDPLMRYQIYVSLVDAKAIP
ncbi:MAG TPA: hypothetical protein VL524_15640 [Gemmatimonadaceae bacterium]|nr:hypothetical protein [Gemmatimonadaceae bacterium]